MRIKLSLGSHAQLHYALVAGVCPASCRLHPPTGEEAALGKQERQISCGRGRARGISVTGGSWSVLGPEEEVGRELLNAFRGLRKRERVPYTETCKQGLLQVG